MADRTAVSYLILHAANLQLRAQRSIAQLVQLLKPLVSWNCKWVSRVLGQ